MKPVDPGTTSILILGGSGFVGTTLVRRLLDRGHSVTLLNRGRSPVEGTEQLVADRNDRGQMSSAASRLGFVDAVIDTSCYLGSQAELAWECFSPRTRRLVHLGSAAVYKETPGRAPTENDEIGGAAVWGDYGRDKSAADAFLIEQRGPIPCAILRPPYLYGPGNDSDRETFVWSRALRGRKIVIPGDGMTPIQFLHVEDLASAIICLLDAGFENTRVYNVAAAEKVTLSDYVARLSAICGAADPTGVLAGEHAGAFQPRQYFPFRDYPCIVDTDRLKRDLDWEPSFDFAGGFRHTFERAQPNTLATRTLDTTVEDAILARVEGK
ncbi:MAG: NAD-dependent epimerase/dehydratase family protein [Polyangiaceae bacterium]